MLLPRDLSVDIEDEACEEDRVILINPPGLGLDHARQPLFLEEIGVSPGGLRISDAILDERRIHRHLKQELASLGGSGNERCLAKSSTCQPGFSPKQELAWVSQRIRPSTTMVPGVRL